MKAIDILKKFKLAFVLAAAVLIGLLCFVACGKDGAKDKGGDKSDKKPVKEVVTSISVDTTNAKLVYELGGSPFDTAGVALVKHLDDGTQKPALLTNDMVELPDMTTRGEKTVKVNYGEFTAEYTITVRQLSTFTVNADNVKTSFDMGDDFSADGLQVVAAFFDVIETEAVQEGNGGYTVTAPDMTSPGIKTVKVEYCGMEKSYEIAVRKAPTISEATVMALAGVASGVVDVRISGKLEGYTQADISFNMQKLMSDVYVTEDLSVSSSFAPADGSFSLTVQVDRAALEKMTDANDVGYMLHMVVNGISYDVVDVEEEVNAQAVLNGTYYRLKGEQCFSDNESKFAILRVADSEELLNPKSLAVNAVKLEKRGDKLGLVISGDVSGLNLDGLIIQLREKSSWENTIELTTTTEIDGETFTAFAEIPDGDTRIHSGSVMFTRMLLPGYIDESDDSADKELHDLPSVTAVTVEFGVGSYALKQESLYDAKQLVTILYASSAVDYEITDVKLEIEDGKLYYVIDGTFDGSTESWTPVIDMQRTYGSWDRINMIGEASVSFGDGTFVIKQDITGIAFDIDQEEGKPCMTHLFVRGQSGDVKNVNGFTDMSVDFEKNGTTYTYSVYASDIFSDGVYYICFKVTTAQA